MNSSKFSESTIISHQVSKIISKMFSQVLFYYEMTLILIISVYFNHPKLMINVCLVTQSTHISLVQQVTGPRITPVKSNLDQSKVQWSK